MSTLEDTVRALVAARREAVAVAAPVLADAATAYAVQDGVAAALGWFGDAPPRHWKSGAASLDTLATHAPLPPAGVWASPADARRGPWRLRGIEAEVALRLGRDVDAALAAGLELAACAALVDAMAVAIEIVESRWTEGVAAPALARLADLQSHGALVLGAWRPFAGRDWSVQACSVQIGTQAPQAFRGSHSLGDPLRVLPAWLRHATAGGRALPAGTVVTTGTWCGLLRAQPGDRVVVRFDGLGEAAVQF